MSIVTIDGDSLSIKTSPGIYRWERRGGGAYAYSRGILGGGGSGQHTAAEVAQIVIRHAPDDYEQPLTELGWLDVLKAIQTVVQQARREEVRKRIEELPGEIAELRTFLERHEGWSYQQFRQQVYNAARASGAADDEMSIQRHHLAAIDNVNLLKTGPAQLADMIAELLRVMPPDRK